MYYWLHEAKITIPDSEAEALVGVRGLDEVMYVLRREHDHPIE